jgi:hypothetical protein
LASAEEFGNLTTVGLELEYFNELDESSLAEDNFFILSETEPRAGSALLESYDDEDDDNEESRRLDEDDSTSFK